MNYHGEIPEFRARYRYLVVVVVLSFVVLVGRLWQLQISQGEHYRRLTVANFVQELRVPTVRGRIFDRRGRVMVDNRAAFDVYAIPRFVTPLSSERLERELQLDAEQARQLRQTLARARERRRYQQVVVARDISRDQLARLETHRHALKGFHVVAVTHRHYVHGNLAAHVLGYLNEVSPRDLLGEGGARYQAGDLIGRYGVERMYEAHLRGVAGKDRVVVDASGERQGEAMAQELLSGKRHVAASPGHDIVLTIDLELQRLVERALARYPSGAAVVIDVRSGKILASASRPSFDPNVLSGRLTLDEHQRLMSDAHRPLLDKVTRENYFPGSTFKVVTAIAGLEQGVIDPEEKIVCKRLFLKYRRAKRCSHAHGKTNLHKSIVESCNIFYYTLSERVGLDTIAHYARLLGLGASTGLGLNSEVAGRVPTKAWYRKQKRRFLVGDTLNASIGQGDVKVTPLQLANLYATLANGGRLYLPQIVESINARGAGAVQTFEARVRRTLRLKPDTLPRIQRALRDVVDDREGTAHDAKISGSVAVSGKTGTAQVARKRKELSESFWLRDHAWFAAYAPSEAPEIAVAVLVAHGGRAAKVAAPVAMRIIDGYFRFVKPYAGQKVPVATDTQALGPGLPGKRSRSKGGHR